MHWWEKQGSSGTHSSTRLELCAKRFSHLVDQMSRFYELSQYYELLFQKRSVARSFVEDQQFHDYANSDVIHYDEDSFDFNIIRQNCVAAKNRISTSKPEVSFLTENEDYETIQIASKLSNHVSGIFQDQGVYTQDGGPKGFLHATLMKLGLLYIEKYNKINVMHPRKFFCSNPYKGSSQPMEGGHFDMKHPMELIKMFPSKKMEIEEAHMKGAKSLSDVKMACCVQIIKAGYRRCIFTKGVMLSDMAWTHPFIPYEPIRWEQSSEGVLQNSISDELFKMQNAIQILMSISIESFMKIGIPAMLVESGSGVSEESILETAVGRVIEYSAGHNPPTPFTPAFLHPQYIEIMNMFLNRSFQLTGNNPMDISGELPRELNQASGVALRNYSDMDSRKFSDIRKAYEEVFISLAKKVLLMGGKTALNYDKDLMKISLKEELKKIKISDKTSMVEEFQKLEPLINAGMDYEAALGMLKHPDAKAHLSSVTDRIRAVDLLIEKAIESNEKPVLYKELGIDTVLERARKQFATLLIKRGEDYPPLVKLSEFIEEVNMELNNDRQIVEQTMT